MKNPDFRGREEMSYLQGKSIALCIGWSLFKPASIAKVKRTGTKFRSIITLYELVRQLDYDKI